MLEWVRRAARRVNEVDAELVRRSAALPRTVADPALGAVTVAANHGLLWFSVAALLASRQGVTRRAALRGVAALAGASLTTNAVAKPLLPRRRPVDDLVPEHRRLADRPRSSSFPSGHAASAAAFATAVAMESPAAGAVVAPLAAAVAYSRVHTGVHWPSDVAGGALLGTAVAVATRRWWPVRPTTPGQARADERVPALTDGAGLLVLVNPASGDQNHDPSAELARVWPAATLVHPDGSDGEDLAETLDRVLHGDWSSVRALGVAGGDGTVAAAAVVAARHGLPLVVVPAGTLNHFARDVGVPDLAGAAHAVAEGAAVRVDLAAVRVDDGPSRSFVNTASLGGYPEMVRLRERWTGRWGKWAAGAAALVRVLAGAEPLTVRVDGQLTRVWLLFVGNNGYHPQGLAPAWRPRLDHARLDLRYVRADVRFSRLRFALAALTGALTRSRVYVRQERQSVEVEVLGPPVALARDGEVSARGAEGNRFRFVARDRVLRVYRPAEID
ncbi:bifunctional phosphatase PAP2/diacylglycerol kinase family protein [Streptoalloteichus hindustanus]|uniref:Undecaprenyl-diphosphatase n=1 Tax=Streptoalloteichus hindustanus TaxID=2017 RepID=A0A1M4YHZ1_STRHI|nr:bifunctional phosphatase PAP2/diacylglycerol kinase family protein [Streptoalloteichus hindustanus]SHF05349.1 undecaprenyl-diphosphatase [Streptoalloteichus hindustanus]